MRGGFGFRVWDLIATILRVWGFLILSVESFMYLLSVFWVAVSYVGFAAQGRLWLGEFRLSNGLGEGLEVFLPRLLNYSC